MLKTYHAVLAALIFTATVLAGCSSTNEMEIEKSNLRRQMALQRQLQNLNNQNEQLKNSITESSTLNRENTELLNNALVKENPPELDQLLQEYKQTNQKTQMALDSIERSIENDAEKNANLLNMLDGFSARNQQQQSSLDQIEEALGSDKKADRSGDNVHIGISPQHMLGSAHLISKDLDSDVNYNYSGTAATAYFTYVGESNAAWGLKYMTLAGKLEPEEELANGAFHKMDGYLGLISLGYRLSSVKAFNIVPELLYGVGENLLIDCNNTSCSDETYYKTSITAVGVEIPFYHQLSVAFSWGFKITGYRITSDGAERYENGSKKSTLDLKTETTYAGLGLMAGLAW